VEPTGREGQTDLDLLVIVPRDLPSRLATLKATLAGTAIRVLADRRQGERRRSYQAVAAEQRHRDRRTTPRVVAWVYACPVVAVATSPTAGTPPATGSTPNPGRQGTAPGFTGPRGHRSLVSAAHSVSRSPRLFPVPLIGLLPWLAFDAKPSGGTMAGRRGRGPETPA